MPQSIVAFRADPFSYREARALADELGVSEPIAVTLVRRGYRTPEAARTFLEADESHSPSEFGSMEEVVGRILAAVEAGRRITIHGDFDVDGVCATTILVEALRGLGADCDWLIPGRLDDGYGLAPANLERLAERGTSLLITVDCGVAAAEEVKLAKSLGMEVIVTDHHRPGDELPDCPVLHPALDGYPFEELCGAAVAWKLASALRAASGVEPPGNSREGEPGAPAPDAAHCADLDLVALATVADIVPLVGENRALVRRGLDEMRRVRRPGIRALLEVAGGDPDTLDETALAFRLAPRINAVGRLYRADAGVELLLTESEERAAEISKEMNKANDERRSIEREAEQGAEAARRELPDHLRQAPGMVLAGEGWHPGVIGVVASRLADRHYRPVVVVSLDGEGNGRGSGRSIPGFDLLEALQACSEHLVRFGGHRGAAGLELKAESLEAFREAFAAHASATLGAEDLKRTERVDAMVGGAGIDMGLAEELERLAPFGRGNPGVRLLVPSARVSDVRTMGKKGNHTRFNLRSGSHRAVGVAFGRSELGVEEDDPVDVTVRLEVNRWNGSVEPRVVLGELYPLVATVDGSESHSCRCPDEEWWERFELELRGGLNDPQAGTEGLEAKAAREAVRCSGSAASVIAELLSSGSGVLAVSADASTRSTLAGGAVGLARFNGGTARVACSRCAKDVVAGLGDRTEEGLALIDYAVLDAAPELAEGFRHVVLVDPAPSARYERLAMRPSRDGGEAAHPGYLHMAWSEAGANTTTAALERQCAQRSELVEVFRDLREAGEASGEALRRALEGEGASSRSPEAAARCFRVMSELGLLVGSPDGGSGSVGVVSSVETDLERSAAFRAYSARHREGLQYLAQHQQP